MLPLPHDDTPLLLDNREAATSTILSLLGRANSILITSHARPDGDSVGSALGAMHLVEALGKQAIVCLADPVPAPFTVLPGAERIGHSLPSAPVDIALVLECDSVARTGYRSLPARLLINIDHHQSGTAFAGVNWIDPASPAVGAMLYDLAVASGVPLSPNLASCLYAAVLTDTVSFTLPSTTSETFDLARHLLELGADAAGISEAIYRSQSQSKLRLLGAVLRSMKVNGPVASGCVTRAEMEHFGAGVEDSEGIVQHLISLEGVQAAALLREMPGAGNLLRASLRSKGGVNVAHVAESFGGGGHHNASGCSIAGTLKEVSAAVEKALLQACRQAQSPGKVLVG